MKLRDLYGRLTSEKRIQFWTITSTMFSTILMFWLGFTIQYFVLEKNTEAELEAEQNVHFQLVNHIYPIYQEQHFENSQILAAYHSMKNRVERLKLDDSMISLFLAKDLEKICDAAVKSAYIMDKARFYFDEDVHQQISANNMMLFYGAKMISMFRPDNIQNIDSISIRDSIDLSSRLVTMHWSEDTILKRKMISQIYNLAKELRNDTILGDTGLKIAQGGIARNILLDNLQQNEYIMNKQLHKLVQKTDDGKMSVSNTIHSIRQSLSSGKNLPQLVYSIIMLFFILMLGTIIWLIIIRMTFAKEDGTLLAKSYVEIEKEIESLKHEIIELKNGGN